MAIHGNTFLGNLGNVRTMGIMQSWPSLSRGPGPPSSSLLAPALGVPPASGQKPTARA